ncbi:collagen alpha-1(III) chain-like [Accipiter gentilis]|nr:collagen alpha-1(III) chain-like [Accipiter gentilis]
MAESAPGPRGPDPGTRGSSSGKTTMPGAALFRCPRTSRPRDPPGEGSDGGSETPTSSVIPSEEEEKEEEEEEEEEGHQWRVGDACVTTWAGDGRLYPAHLRALDPAAGTCLVEFDGYGNTEEQALADLLPPRPGAWGSPDTPGGEGPPSSWEPPPSMRRRKGKRVPCFPQPPEVLLVGDAPTVAPSPAAHPAGGRGGGERLGRNADGLVHERVPHRLLRGPPGRPGRGCQARPETRPQAEAPTQLGGQLDPVPRRRGGRRVTPRSCSPLTCGGVPSTGVLAAVLPSVAWRPGSGPARRPTPGRSGHQLTDTNGVDGKRRLLVEALQEVLEKLGSRELPAVEKRLSWVPLCEPGDPCAVRRGARIGKLCSCPRGTACNLFILKCS